MSANPGPYVFPKRWSRAKRKRHRAAAHWLNHVYGPALRKLLDKSWGDEMTDESPWQSFVAAESTGPFVDDGLFLVGDR